MNTAKGLALILTLLVLSVHPLYTQETTPPSVTVVTREGDVVEGRLVAMSTDELVLKIVGQEVSLPLGSVEYVSFVGELDQPTVGADESASPIDLAFEALDKLRTAVAVGVLRAQYSELLVTHLTPVREFIERDDGWWDVRIALEKAVGFFQQPLSSTSAWSSASRDFTRAATFVDIATKLAAFPDAPDHVESRDVTPIEVGGRIEGRLGHGDWLMPRELDRFSTAGFNDHVSFTLEERSSVEIVMDCNSPFCRSTVTLVDAQGASIETNSGSLAKIQQTLEPGKYLIWAGTSAGFIGFYTLELNLV